MAFTELEKKNQVLAKKLEQVIIKAKHLGATRGAKRLELVGNQFEKLTLEEAHQIINLEATLAEVEESRGRWVGFLHVIRNVLALCPLFFTWFALYRAANGYQWDLAHYTDEDKYRPFLLLWQEGFHGTTWPRFSDAALTDVVLLGLFIAFIILIPTVETLLHRWGREFTRDMQDVADGLLEFVGVAGINPITSDADVDKVVQKIKQTVASSLLASQKAAEQATQFIAASEGRVNRVIGDFHQDLATFNMDLLQLTTNLQNYTQQTQDLATASQKMAQSSVDLQGSANKMALSADKSAMASTGMTQASQDIGAQLGTLNATQLQIVSTQKDVVKEISTTQQQVVQEIATTQQQVVHDIGNTQQQVVQKIEAAQKDVVKEITTSQQQMIKDLDAAQQQVVQHIEDAADKMDTVAKDTKQVAKELGQITKADIQAMTNKVADTANQVDKVAASLAQIDQQLQTTTQALQQAAQALAMAAARPKRQVQPPPNVPPGGTPPIPQPSQSKHWWQFWK